MSDPTKPKYAHFIDELSEFALKVKARGDDKHGPGTWAELAPVEFVDAAIRHLVAIRDGEFIDEDTGCPHWACVLVNAHYGYASHMLRFNQPAVPLNAVLRLQDVKRWHIVRTAGEPQTVASHSYNVAMIGRRYLELTGQKYLIGTFLEAALRHDEDESLFGDIPSPAKSGAEYRESGELEFVLKLSDKLDALREITEVGLGAYAQKTQDGIRSGIYDFVLERFGTVPGAVQQLMDEVLAVPKSLADAEESPIREAHGLD